MPKPLQNTKLEKLQQQSRLRYDAPPPPVRPARVVKMENRGKPKPKKEAVELPRIDFEKVKHWAKMR